jgi:hypothetical protein
MLLTKLRTLTGLPASQIVEKLSAPFEPAAYRAVPGAADLTDIGTGYMLERATQVFGLRGLGWQLVYAQQDMGFTGPSSERRVTAHLRHAAFRYALLDEDGQLHWQEIITSGASTNEFAFAEEGARTAAIGAALKALCFQLPVYKGQLDHHNAADFSRTAGANGSGPDDPGSYRLQSGRAYTGQSLRQVLEENPKGRTAGLQVLHWYAEEMAASTGRARADQAAARAYLASLEAAAA